MAAITLVSQITLSAQNMHVNSVNTIVNTVKQNNAYCFVGGARTFYLFICMAGIRAGEYLTFYLYA